MNKIKNEKTNGNLLKSWAILYSVLLMSCATTPKIDRSTMTMGFAEAAFGLGIEFEAKHAVVRTPNLVRWDNEIPVKLSIKGEPAGTELYNDIVGQLKNLYSIAAIDLRLDDSPGLQFLNIEVSDLKFLNTDKIKTSCYTSFNNSFQNPLKKVDIVATRFAILPKNSNCLLHEGMHSLGFGGHPHRLKSVLSYTEEANELTPFDFQLIKLLYNKNYKSRMPLDKVVTTIYSELTEFPVSTGKRYTPRDISLQLRQDESPLVLNPPFLKNTSKQFFYKSSKNGERTVILNYGTRESSTKFAELTHSRLSNLQIYRNQLTPSRFAKNYESYLGLVTERSSGYVNHKLGNFKYVVADTPDFSCIFTIKYIDAISQEIGGHQVIYGSYCSDILDPLDEHDAQLFISSVDLLDRNPIEIRERKIALKKNKEQNFSALRLTGNWPGNGSFISGFKLIIQGDPSGLIKLRVDDEICEGVLAKLPANGSGKWAIKCKAHENAAGKYRWNSDGTFSFNGETLTTNKDINWKGYQVF